MLKSYNSLFAAFCVALMLAGPVGSAVRTYDNGGADYKWSTATNWSDNTKPTSTDTAVFNGTSVDSIHVDENFKIASVAGHRAYTGHWRLPAGIACTTSVSCSLDVGGKLSILGGLTQSGDGDVYINSQGTITGYRGRVSLLGTGTYNVQKAFNAFLLCAQSGKTTTVMGAGASPYSDLAGASGRNITTGGGTFAIASGASISIDRDAAGILFNQVSATTFNGDGTLILRGRSTVKDTLSNASFTSTIASIQITITVAGTKPSLYIVQPTSFGGTSFSMTTIASGSASKWTLFLDSALTVTPIVNFGTGQAADSLVVYYGTKTHDFNGGYITTTNNSGKTILYDQTSTKNVAGSIMYGSNTSVVVGTATTILDKATGIDTLSNFLAYGVQKTGASNTVATTAPEINGDYSQTDGSLKLMAGGNFAGNLTLDGVGSNDTVDIVGTVTMSNNAAALHVNGFNLVSTAGCTTAVTGTACNIDADQNMTIAAISAAAGKTPTITGAGTLTVATPKAKTIDSINVAGNLTFGAIWKTRALNITAGTLAITNHAGRDSVTGDMNVANGATINFAVDTVWYGGNVTLGATSTVSATTGKWFAGKDGLTLALNGKSIPLVELIGSANLTSSAATGGTLAGLLPPAAGGDTVIFGIGKKWTFTTLDSAYWNRNIYLSSTAGTKDTLDIPANVVLKGVKAKDQNILAGDTITSTDTGSVDLGNNSANWIFTVAGATAEKVYGAWRKTTYKAKAYARDTWRLHTHR